MVDLAAVVVLLAAGQQRVGRALAGSGRVDRARILPLVVAAGPLVLRRYGFGHPDGMRVRLGGRLRNVRADRLGCRDKVPRVFCGAGALTGSDLASDSDVASGSGVGTFAGSVIQHSSTGIVAHSTNGAPLAISCQ